jgi:dTDP-glucose 4,6-dehydratase
MKNVLITGGVGFVGHHMVDYLLRNSDANITIIDRLDVSGNLNRLTELPSWKSNSSRVKFVWHDLRAELYNNEILCSLLGEPDTVLHIGAGSHVDRSIEDPLSFVMDNVVGTCNILNYARHLDNLDNFVYFSTDEVFGPAPEGVNYKEWDRYQSGNPYSATKAGGEELCLAFENTYKMPIKISHCMNIFGERQHPEKFIPSCIRKIYRGEKVIIHANKSLTLAGSRFYIHAQNVCSAVDFILKNGKNGDKFNIVGEREIDNLSLAKMIADIMDKPLNYELVDFHSSRPGHDLRYALDGTKMKEMGWDLPMNLSESMEAVVKWSLSNPQWIGMKESEIARPPLFYHPV